MAIDTTGARAGFRAARAAILDPASAITGLDAVGKVLGPFEDLAAILQRPDMPPATRTRTSHGAYLYAQVDGAPRVLGAVQGISEQQAQANRDVFEINPRSDGTPNHIESSNLTSRQINCKLIELNDGMFERLLKRKVEGLRFNSLISLIPEFNLVSLDHLPSGGIKYQQFFLGCKVDSFGRSRAVDDDRLVRCDVVFRWTRLYDAR